MAEMFAEEGAKVVLSGRSVDKGEKNVERIRAAGGEAMFLPIDVTDEDSVRDGVAAAVDAYGPITTLVNNAAPTALVNVSFKPLHELYADRVGRHHPGLGHQRRSSSPSTRCRT